MRKTIFVLAVLLMFVFAGCGSQVNVNESKDSNTEVNDGEENQDFVVEYVDQFDKLLVQIRAIADYESNSASKQLVQNVLNKVSKVNTEFRELEESLDKVDQKSDFEQKEKFVSVNKEFIQLLKKIVNTYSELYNYELDWAKYWESQEDYNLEDLAKAIYNCGCSEFDCDSYKESYLKAVSSATEIFKAMGSKYNLEVFDRLVEYLIKEKQVSEKYLPELIDKSERYSAARCYKLNDDYIEYWNALEQIEEVPDSDVEKAADEKWFVPINNLLTEWDASALQIDKLKVEMGFELI